MIGDLQRPGAFSADGQSWLKLSALFFVPLVLATIAYLPYLDDYFVLDDWIWLRESRRGDVWTVMRHAFSFPREGEFGTPTISFRPLTDLVFKIMYDTFGLRPEAYHTFNLLLHVGFAALSGWFVVRLSGRYWPGLAAAIVFVSAPTYDIGVVWISQAPELISAVLSAVALHAALSYLRLEDRRRAITWLVVSAASVALALLAKQPAIATLAVLPLLCLATPDLRRSRRELIAGALVMGVIGLVYGAILLVEQRQDPSVAAGTQFGLRQGAEGFALYAGHVVWPFGGDTVRILVGAAYAGLAVLLLFARQRAALFLLSWSALALMPFVTVPVAVAQWRYTYVATFGFLACFAVSIDAALMSLGDRVRSWLPAAACCVCVVVALAWIPETRSRLDALSSEAHNYEVTTAAIRAQCGELPPGAAVYVMEPLAFDPFLLYRNVINTFYTDVYYRVGAPPAQPVGDPVCVVHVRGAAESRP